MFRTFAACLNSVRPGTSALREPVPAVEFQAFLMDGPAEPLAGVLRQYEIGDLGGPLESVCVVERAQEGEADNLSRLGLRRHGRVAA